ncbi:MAG: DUF1232 domain-containing protein [Polyangiaceae bacterium]|mgnify:CR=1 FL=1|nr:DUF1232 domain-containing protein [Polyangiaceae bacterium]
MQERATDLGTTLRFFLNPKAGFFAKLFLVLAVLYVIMPLDLVPDVVVIVGWIDDLVALLGASTGLLFALRRYQRQQGGTLQARRPDTIAPQVVETQGTEVR